MNQLLQWLSDLVQGARFWVTVLPWESAVRVRWGKHALLWGPGLHWRIPYVDQVRVINTRLRLASVPCVTVTTKDNKTVTVAGTVGFRISDPYKALLTVQHPEGVAAALAQSELCSYVMENCTAALDKDALEQQVLSRLQTSACLSGFEFEMIKVVDFAIVRTLRLLQEQWRPGSEFTNFEPPKN